MRVLVVLALLLSLTFPVVASAHTGVQEKADDTIVTFYQDPIAPIVGQPAKFSIYLSDLNNNPLTNVKVILQLIDTTYNQPTNDKKLLIHQYTTDQNGFFIFDYTFPKENYFDIELEYKSPDGTLETVGLLVQPRQLPQTANSLASFENLIFFLGGIGFSLIGVGLGQLIRRRA